MKKYSDKEIGIFNGVIKLLRQGRRMNELKASEIAEASNIGKGTLYDYFSSKNEILIHTILYSIDHELKYCEEMINGKSFTSQTDCILKEIGKKSNDFLAVRLLMVDNMHFVKRNESIILKYQNDFENLRQRLEQILSDYIEKGIFEKVITIENSKTIKEVILLLFKGFIASQNCNCLNDEFGIELDKRIEIVKIILYKALKAE